jgi:recombination protein RecT
MSDETQVNETTTTSVVVAQAAAPPARRPLSPEEQRFRELEQTLRVHMRGFRRLLPRGVSEDFMLLTVLKAIKKSKELRQCDPASITLAMIECAGLGLVPNTELGEAHIVPYGRDAKLVIGYSGLLKLVRSSGEVACIDAYVAHADDVFDYELGDNPRVKHVPRRRGSGAPEPVFEAAYATARLRGSEEFLIVDVMDAAQIDKIRARGSRRANGPWDTDYDEMAKKTVLRRLSKRLPKSREAGRGLALDQRGEGEGAVLSVQEWEEELQEHTASAPDAPPPSGALGEGRPAAAQPAAAQPAAGLKTALREKLAR